MSFTTRPSSTPGPVDFAIRRSTSCSSAPAAAPARRLHSDGGAAAIEFALFVPFLVLVIFGTVDVARAWSLRNSLTNMAREGSTVARLYPYNHSTTCSPSIQTAARNEDPSIVNPVVTVTRVSDGSSLHTSFPCGTPYANRTRVQVRVTAEMTLLTPVMRSLLANGSSVTVGSDVEVLTPG